jgi:hypothetical protein
MSQDKMPGSFSERLGNFVPVALWEDAFAAIDETSGSTRHFFVTARHVDFKLKLTFGRGKVDGQFDPCISGAAAEASFDPRSGKNLGKTSVQGRGSLAKQPATSMREMSQGKSRNRALPKAVNARIEQDSNCAAVRATAPLLCATACR